MTNIFLLFAPSIWHELIFRLLPTRCPVCGSTKIKPRNGRWFIEKYTRPSILCYRCSFNYNVSGEGIRYDPYWLDGTYIGILEVSEMKWS